MTQPKPGDLFRSKINDVRFTVDISGIERSSDYVAVHVGQILEYIKNANNLKHYYVMHIVGKDTCCLMRDDMVNAVTQ